MKPEAALGYFLIAAGLGALCETMARVLRLWVYRSVTGPVLNVILMFGLVHGVLIAGAVGGGRPMVVIAPVLFMIGAVTGLVYEGLNEARLHVWTWPDRPLIGVKSPLDKAAAVGVAWGFTPILVALLARLPLLH